MGRAITTLEEETDPKAKKNDRDPDSVRKLLEMCKIHTMLEQRDMIGRHKTKTAKTTSEATSSTANPRREGVVKEEEEKDVDIPADVAQQLFVPLTHTNPKDPTEDIGILDLQHSDSKLIEDFVNTYEHDSEIVDCLYTNNSMYVTLDHSGEGKFTRGVHPSTLGLDNGSSVAMQSHYSGNNTSGTELTGASSNVQAAAAAVASDSHSHSQPLETPDLHIPQEGDLDPEHHQHHYQILKIPYMSSWAEHVAQSSGMRNEGSNGVHVNPNDIVEAFTERERELKELFSRIDKNKDGRITREELFAARDEELLQGSDKDIEALHEWMDSQRRTDGH